MMHTAFTLSLSRSLATQFVETCAAYREFAWHALEPSPERNQSMKAVQAIQGRVSELRRSAAEPLLFTINEQERQVLRQMIEILMRAYAAGARGDERTSQLGCLASLRILIERACRQTHIC